jgi:hypothetical protein
LREVLHVLGLLLVVLLCLALLPYASASSMWSRTYGGAGRDKAFAIIGTSDGGYVLAGTTDSFGAGGYDFWLLKTDSSGNVQWNRTYGGERDDVAFSVAATSEGGYILAGATNYPILDWLEPTLDVSYQNVFYPGVEALVVKTDANGNMQWNKTYHVDSFNVAHCIIQVSDGGYAFCGETANANFTHNTSVVFKTDSYGTTLWCTFFNFSAGSANSIVEATNGGYAVAGRGLLTDGAFQLSKIKSDGSLQWNKTYSDQYSFPDLGAPFSLIKTSDGGYALAGKTEEVFVYNSDFVLLKIDGDGNLKWRKMYYSVGMPSWGDDYANAVIQTSDGGYALAGYWNYNYRGNIKFQRLEPISAAMLVKTDASGNQEWTKVYEEAQTNGAYGVLETPDDGYVLAGYTWSDTSGIGSYDMWLLKTDEVGIVPEISSLLILTFTLMITAPILLHKKRLLHI